MSVKEKCIALDLDSAFRNGNYSLSVKRLSSHETKSIITSLRLANTSGSLYGDTILHLACRHGWLDVVKCLIEEYGFHPDIQDKQLWTPLHYACRYGHFDVVHYLTSYQQCDVMVSPSDLWTPLHYACRYGYTSIVEYLTSLPGVVQKVDQSSLLHLTCKYGQSSIFIYLMDKKGFTHTASDKKEPGLLLTACQYNHIAIVMYLLQRVSDYHGMEFKECKALFMLCCKNGLLDIIKQLTHEVEEVTVAFDSLGNSGIHYACQNGHTAIVQYLVEKCGCNINMQDKCGLSPLHVACKYGKNVDLVKYLLSRTECDVLAVTNDGSTALHCAAMTEEFDFQLVNILTEHGAYVSKATCRFIESVTMRHSNLEAIEHMTVKSTIVSCLLAQHDVAKCNPSVRNYSGFSPVHVSIYPFIVHEVLTCHAQTHIYKLIEKGHELYVLFKIKHFVSTGELDLNETASNGDSVLHIACVANKPKIARYFLKECNFDPNIKNNTGDTPLELALRFSTYKMMPKNNLSHLVSLFISHTRPNLALTDCDQDGNTLLHLACLANQHQLISTTVKKVDSTLTWSKNKEGYIPFELITSPKLIARFALEVKFTYTFEPGTIHHFIWFCRSIESGQLEHVLNKGLKKIKWEHNLTTECHTGHQMLYLKGHQIWLLIKVCFHCDSDTHIRDSKGCPTKDSNHIFVIEIMDHMKDRKFTGIETTETLLYIASGKYRYHLVEHLISALKGSSNQDFKRSALIEKTSDLNIMQLLIQHGVKIESRCINKLFVVAATTKKDIHPDTFRILKNTKQWNPNTVCNSNGDTALHLSASYHMYRVAMYLLTETNCDPAIVNNSGETPIHLLMSIKSWSDSECISVLKSLISKRAWDPNSVCNPNSDTAFHLCVWYYRREVAHYLLSETQCDPNLVNLKGIQPVQMLMSKNSWSDSERIDMIKALMTTRLWDPNSSCSSNQETVLHLSVQLHRYKVTHYLLSEAKCDPQTRNREGETAIGLLLSAKQWLGSSWSVKSQSANSWSDSECFNIIKVMLYTGLWDCNSSCNSKGDTVLHLSAKQHRCDLMNSLLSDVKCDPKCRNKKGETIVQFLMSKGQWTDTECIKAIKALTSTKLWDPDSSCNSNGDTALHLSMRHKRYEVTSFLLSEAKCDPNIRNQKGESLVHLLLPLTVQKWTDSQCINLMKALMSSRKWNPDCSCDLNGDTILHLSVRHKRHKVVHFLLSEANCNPNITNTTEKTPLQIITDPNVITELIRYGANSENVYKSYGKSVGLTKPLIPPVKVFIIGYSGVGKSTLIESLKIETSSLVKARNRVTNVEGKTAGIIPHEFQSKLYGQVIFYDFAGHKEFYNSHIALLQNDVKSSSPIFLIVANLNQSEEEIQESIQVWLSFIDDNSSIACSKPYIIIIGSHADVVLKKGENVKILVSKITNYVQRISQDMALEYVGMFPIDCRYTDSTNMAELRSCLKDSCKSLRISGTICFNTHCFYVFLFDKFRKSIAVTINNIQMEIGKITSNNEKGVVNYLPDSVSAITLVCDELNDRGHILFLKNHDELEKSWIVINKAAILSKVTGTIFAPNDFKEHCQIAESTGVVQLSQLIKEFPTYDNEVLIGVLTHLEYCHEVKDDELCELIRKHRDRLGNTITTDENERYFLFPGLITINAPDCLWKQNHIFKYHCFWTIRCRHQNQCFSSRFTQVILLRLAFKFPFIKKETNPAIPSFQRECSIWKNGIFWGEIFGMEVIIEIYSKKVVLIMRCREENIVHFVAKRTIIIQTILECVHDFCRNIETIESFIDPSEATEFPLKSPVSSSILQFSLPKIAETIVKSTDYNSASIISPTGTFPLDHLLIFEPYTELGRATLSKLCLSEDGREKIVSDDFLKLLSYELRKNARFFIEIFKSDSSSLHLRQTTSEDLYTVLQAWRDECKGTYKCLKDKLDQFSVFAERNVIACELSTAAVHIPEARDYDDKVYCDTISNSKRLEQIQRRNTYSQNKQISPTYWQNESNELIFPVDDFACPADESDGFKLSSHFSAIEGLKISVSASEMEPSPFKQSRIVSQSETLPIFNNVPKLHQLDLLEWNGKRVKVIDMVAAQWDSVAIRLYFESYDISRIGRDYPQQSIQATVTVFNEWINGKGRQPPSWHTLIEALKETDVQELKHVACNLESILRCLYEESATETKDITKHLPDPNVKPKLTELNLLMIIEDVAYKWKDLAVALDFNKERIDRIDSGASRLHKEACRQMFEEWLGEDEDLKEPVTWTTLVQCLIDAGMIEIADKLKEIKDPVYNN